MVKRRKYKKSNQTLKLITLFVSLLLFSLFSIFHGSELFLESFSKNETIEEESNHTSEELNSQLNELIEDEIKSLEEQTLQDNLKVHYLDVGQGDSTFIELPNKETILIDAGEKDMANRIIEYIKNIGYKKIDYIIATHPHADHIGGLATIIENFEIGSIYMPKAVSTSKTYENLLNTILEKGLKIKIAKKEVEIRKQEDLEIKFVAPNKDSYKDLNNYSAVLKLTYKNNSFLFMGDAEVESEDEIIDDIKADVIKVGHHGSNTSSSEAFVAKVSPKYAIISVGKNNTYHHPHSEILKRWEKIGAKILRTDELGNITMTSDGNVIMQVE